MQLLVFSNNNTSCITLPVTVIMVQSSKCESKVSGVSGCIIFSLEPDQDTHIVLSRDRAPVNAHSRSSMHEGGREGQMFIVQVVQALVVGKRCRIVNTEQGTANMQQRKIVRDGV